MERSTRSINAVGIPVSSGRGGCQVWYHLESDIHYFFVATC